MNNKKKLRCFIVSLSLIMIGSHYASKNDHKHNIYVKEDLIEEPLYFRSCSAGDVYIGTSNQFEKTSTPNGIIVIDERDSNDPDMKIACSYRITSKQSICEILKILEEYEELHPSKWNRSLEAMKNEWEVHNLLHSFNYRLDHTTDVDLDNEDETKFNSKVLTRTLKNNE